MGITHLSGLEIAGVPIINSGGAPFFTGNWIFVNAVTGSDGNTGAADSPLQTLLAAYNKTTDGNNDVVVLVGAPTASSSTAGTFRLSAQLVWAKSATHLVGMCAPTMLGQRARISTATGATLNIADLLKITGQGCLFQNFSIFQGVGQVSTAEQLCQITGQRNAFVNVAFQGIASANGAGQAASYSIYLNGAQENTFYNCQIGTDTVSRTTTNASIICKNQATRNVFRDCIFPMDTTGTSLFVDVSAVSALDRFLWFKSCLFTAFGTACAAALATNGSNGGTTIMDNCTLVNCTQYSATATDVTVQVTGSVPTGHTSGRSVSSATT